MAIISLFEAGGWQKTNNCHVQFNGFKIRERGMSAAAAQQVVVSANKVVGEFCQQEGQLVLLLQAFAG